MPPTKTPFNVWVFILALIPFMFQNAAMVMVTRNYEWFDPIMMVLTVISSLLIPFFIYFCLIREGNRWIKIALVIVVYGAILHESWNLLTPSRTPSTFTRINI